MENENQYGLTIKAVPQSSLKHCFSARRIFRKILLVITVLICFVNLAAARQIYVVPSGGRPDGRGTINDPLDTLGHALEQGLAGDTVVLRKGIHQAGDIWYTGQGGRPGEFLTIAGYPNERAVVIGRRLVVESQYMRIQNIEFHNFVITVRHQERNHWRYSHHIEILNDKFSNSGVAIYFCCNDGIIQGNTFDPAYYAIYLMHGNGNVIRGNDIRNTSKYSVHIYDEDKYNSTGEPHPKITNLLVENNVIDGSRSRSGIVVSGGDYSKPPIEINGVLIRNNLILNNSTGGITFQGDGWIKNIEIYNNTLYGNPGGGIRINQDKEAESITIINNILSNNGSSHLSGKGKVTRLVVRKNLYWSPTSVGSDVNDSSPVLGNPLFENAVSGDFHLKDASVAIDKGESLAKVTTDKDGKQRPAGSAYDIGAYEYGLGDKTAPTAPKSFMFWNKM
jgi:parallel beta-helix repeat protein